MNLTDFSLKTVPGYESWLEEQIRQLSIQALQTNTMTCNACGEVAGTYIIEYDGRAFRLSGEDAYTFLNFVIGRHS